MRKSNVYVLLLLCTMGFDFITTHQSVNKMSLSSTADDSNDLSGCVGQVSCRVSYDVKSNKSKLTVDYSISFVEGKAQVSPFAQLTGDTNKTSEATIQVLVAGCETCARQFAKSTPQAQMLQAIGPAIKKNAEKRVEQQEQARLDEEKRKLNAKAFERCEKSENGEAFDHSERLSCMNDRMSDMNEKEQKKYYADTVLPFMNKLLGSQSESDRTAVKDMLENFNVADQGINESLNVLRHATQVQEAITLYARRFGTNTNTAQGQLAAMQLQNGISQDPNFYNVRTQLGQQTASYWQAESLNEIQVAKAKPTMFGAAAPTNIENQISQLSDQIRQNDVKSFQQTLPYGAQRVLPNGRRDYSVPVPAANLANQSNSVLTNSCLTRGISFDQTTQCGSNTL